MPGSSRSRSACGITAAGDGKSRRAVLAIPKAGHLCELRRIIEVRNLEQADNRRGAFALADKIHLLFAHRSLGQCRNMAADKNDLLFGHGLFHRRAQALAAYMFCVDAEGCWP